MALKGIHAKSAKHFAKVAKQFFTHFALLIKLCVKNYLSTFTFKFFHSTLMPPPEWICKAMAPLP